MSVATLPAQAVPAKSAAPAGETTPVQALGTIDFATAYASPEPSVGTAPEVPFDLSTLSTRELRTLSNQLYRVLDRDLPPFGTYEDYVSVTEALTERTARAAEVTESEELREKFRDNSVSSRFELFHDGTMVGYVKYHLRAGRIHLLETVVNPGFRGAGLEPVLVKEALLNAHRRRLAPVPYCRHAQAFLAANPQFQALIPLN